MRILRAEHLGMCFGVRDAIALALKQSHREPATVLGDLAHNETVLADLRAQGIRIVQQVGAVETGTGEDASASSNTPSVSGRVGSSAISAVKSTATSLSSPPNNARIRSFKPANRAAGVGSVFTAGSCQISRVSRTNVKATSGHASAASVR